MARKRTKFPKKLPKSLGGGDVIQADGPLPRKKVKNTREHAISPLGNHYGLKPRHFKFFCEYVKDYDRVRAYRAAGYKGKKPDQAAAAILSRTEIKAAIRQWEREQAEESKIGVERVLEELSHIAFCDVRRFFGPDGRLKTINHLRRTEAAAISSIRFSSSKDGDTFISSITLCNKETALLNYGKHLGMFKPTDDRITDFEEIALKFREAQKSMMKTLPLESKKIINGHFG